MCVPQMSLTRKESFILYMKHELLFSTTRSVHSLHTNCFLVKKYRFITNHSNCDLFNLDWVVIQFKYHSEQYAWMKLFAVLYYNYWHYYITMLHFNWLQVVKLKYFVHKLYCLSQFIHEQVTHINTKSRYEKFTGKEINHPSDWSDH